MRAIVRFTLSQTVFFNLVFILMMAAGSFALMEIPVERYPLIKFGKVIITTFYPGGSASDVEALITTRIEDALEDLDQVEFIRSNSFRERSSVLVKFVDDTDYEDLYKELRLKVLAVQRDFPETAEPSDFTLITTSDWLPVVSVNLAGDRSNRALTLMAEELRTPLSNIPGVQEVRLTGEHTREFHVDLDPRRMTRLGVTFDQVAAALNSANLSLPAGDFNNADGQFSITVDERFRSRQDVVQTIIRTDADGSFVRLADVLDSAGLDYRDPYILTSINGRDGVTLFVVKDETSNALSIRPEVDRIVEEFRPRLAEEGVDLVLTQDSTVYIKDAMNTLGANLILGVFLVSLLIWYFMGLRNACLTTVGIPFAFLTSVGIMYLTGQSFNEISLFSFVLVSGIIVDDAIVVVENIYRHVQLGKELRTAIVDGSAEVLFPVISATTTTVAAFLPMLIMTGSTGEFFAIVPKAVTFAILASLIECIFILPIHYLDYGPKPAPAKTDEHGETVHKDNLVLAACRAVTVRLTGLCLRHRVLSLSAVFAAFVFSIAILVMSISGKAQFIRIKFFPDDYNLYYVELEAPATTPLEEVSDTLKEISRFIMADGPGMAAATVANAGFYINEDYEMIFGNNYGYVSVTMPSREDQEFDDPLALLDDITTRVRERFEHDGLIIRVRAEKGGPPTGKAINIRVLGESPDAVARLSDHLLDYMRNNGEFGGHLTDLSNGLGQPGRVFRFHVNEERTAEYGLDVAHVASLAASVLDGRFTGEYRLEDEDVDIRLRMSPRFMEDPEQALSIPLVEHPSGPIRLGDLCEVETYAEPAQFLRFNTKRSVTLSANLASGATVSVPSIIAAVARHYQEIRDDYIGAGIEFGGEYESTQKSYTSLAYAFFIAVMIMYLILANQFKSYVQPLIILSAVVFSLIGVILGKFVTQSLFTVNSFVATVGVTGVVVNDSLVLVDFMNRLRAQGMTRQQAVREGVRIRLRPILLTTLTTTLGLLPMAVGFPYYSLVWGTMASTFVTGLFTATALTLFIVPVQWDMVEQFKEWWGRRTSNTVSG